MKWLIYILFFLISLPVLADTYYVATDGDNADAGSISDPWLTWKYGFNQLTAGDTLYIRGGTYLIPNETSPDARIYLSGVNGTSENPIVVINYPDEVPILDGVNYIQTNFYGIYLNSCDYWELIGLTIRNIAQVEGYASQGILLVSSDNCTINRCVTHNIAGRGIAMTQTDGGLIYNCDSYDNYDDKDDGNSADGFGILTSAEGTTNTIIGCRAWDCSDDGVDFFNSRGTIIMDSCWVFLNGFFHPEFGGDEGDFVGNGTGFKLGLGIYNGTSDYVKLITRCLSVLNESSGFSRNEDYNKIRLYNNLSYDVAGGGFSMGLSNTYTRDTAVLKNNISYLPGTGIDFSSNGQDSTVYNSWDAGTGVTVTAADFAALPADSANCMTVMAAVRQSDGSLPDLGDYFQLAQGSDLIDAGVDVGLDYLDAAPDLGAFEFVTPGSPPSTGYKLTGGDGKILTDGNGKIIIGR